jgi:polyhydroxyalkanoate synthesis regulator phasin
MQVNEFGKSFNSRVLNENMAKTFGYKINLETFTLEQLEDARNRLRTSISTIETNESYDSMLESNEYHKTRSLLDVINRAIQERNELGEAVQMESKKLRKDPDKMAKRFNAMESVSDEWLKVAVWRLSQQQDTARDLIDELVIRNELNEDQAQYVVARLMAEMSGNKEAQRILTEGEEERAELIMASKDMVDKLTGWLEDTASMQAENMLELLDSIRDEMGSEISEKYAAIVKPALAEIYTTLEKNRQALSGAVGILTGDENAQGTGMTPPETPEMEPSIEEPPAIGGTAGESPAGREQRESIDLSRRLGLMLGSKKK